MKKLVLLALTLCAFKVQAGNDVGGGGGFLQNGKVLLLDLVEAKNLKNMGGTTEGGLNIVESSAPVEDQVERALQRLALWPQPEFSTLTQEVRKAYAVALKIKRPIAEDFELSFPSDANLNIKPKSSSPVGIALWEKDMYSQEETLWIDNRYYSLMSNTHKAALLVHEALYKTLRTHFHHTDSRRVRIIVGYLFSDIAPVSAGATDNTVIATLQSLTSKECALSISLFNDENTNTLSVSHKNPIMSISFNPADFKDPVWYVAQGANCKYSLVFRNSAGIALKSKIINWGPLPKNPYRQYSPSLSGPLVGGNFGTFSITQAELTAYKFILAIPVKL